MNALRIDLVLTTRRFTLRAPQERDAPGIEACCSRREIARMLRSVPHPYPPGAAQAYIHDARGRWESGAGIPCVVIDSATGELVASVGLSVNHEHRHAELGYWVAVEWWGKGVATEACEPLIDLGFERMGLHRIFAGYYTHNPASRRVLDKLGFRYEGTLRSHACRLGEMADIGYMGMLRPEWELARAGAVAR